MVAAGTGGNPLAGLGRAHVVDAQIDRRGGAERLFMAQNRGTAAGIHQRRNDAAMDHPRAAVADETLVPGHRDHRAFGPHLFQHHAERLRMGDGLDELPRDPRLLVLGPIRARLIRTRPILVRPAFVRLVLHGPRLCCCAAPLLRNG